MTRPNLRVFGLDDATCDDQYCGSQTATHPPKVATIAPAVRSDQPGPKMVHIRMSDVLDALQSSSKERLRWIDDFRDDPVAITEDLYEVIIAFQRIRRAA